MQIFFEAEVFAENPRWQVYGTLIPASTNLGVRWDGSIKKLPSKIWLYHLLPNHFSPPIISNMMELCHFTEKDRTRQDANGLIFQSADAARKLSIQFSSGTIQYEMAEPKYGLTNLAKSVPASNQIPKLTKNVLQKVGIPLSEITGYFGSHQLEVSEPLTMFYSRRTVVTNIAYRTGYCRRSVDGIPVVGGDGLKVNFGEYANICNLTVAWRKLERNQKLQVITKENIAQLLRTGKARQGLVASDSIYWPAVKSVLIKKARPCYCAGNSDWLYPFLYLSATVDTGHGNVDVEIDCPIVDETNL